MWNELDSGELEKLDLPAIRHVTKQRHEQRRVYLHFFSDSEEFFAAGYDREDQQFYGYVVTRLPDAAPVGSWDRSSLDELVAERSQSEAELTRNVNFTPKNANDVPVIKACEAYNRQA